jgi:tripartite-type tricarboxylate transporter receptor subunit TctC
MKKENLLIVIIYLAVGLMNLWATGGQAGSGRIWPTTRNVEVHCYANAGSGTDAVGRVVNTYLSKKLGTTVYMTNDSSGGGTVAYERVRNGPKDGSLLLWVNTNIIFQYYTKVYSHQVLEDFTCVAVFQVPIEQPVFLVKADSKYKTFKDLIDDAKARPNMISVPTGPMARYYASVVNLERILGVTFRKVDGADFGERVSSVLGGITDFFITLPNAADPYIQNGDLRALAYCWNEPSATLPNVPTMKDFGFTVPHEDFTDGYYMILGPKGMDEKVADAISESLNGIQDDQTSITVLKNLEGGYPVYIPRNDGKVYVRTVDDFAKSVMGE